MRFVERITDTFPFVSIFSACRTEMIRIGSKHEFSKSTGFLVSIRITYLEPSAGFEPAASPVPWERSID